jgi:hypothetical protein
LIEAKSNKASINLRRKLKVKLHAVVLAVNLGKSRWIPKLTYLDACLEKNYRLEDLLPILLQRQTAGIMDTA